jgi:hypothetical protein
MDATQPLNWIIQNFRGCWRWSNHGEATVVGAYGGGINTVAEHEAGEARWVDWLCKNKLEAHAPLRLGFFF